MKTCPHCQSSIDPSVKPRSVQQLKRFFAVLRVMHFQWPESCRFQPRDEEHLRAWVLCRAGHYEVIDIDVPSADKYAMDLVFTSVQAAIKASKSYAFVQPDPDGNRVRVFSPKSISFAKLSPEEFNKLNEAVESVFFNETGINPSDALEQEEQAA